MPIKFELPMPDTCLNPNSRANWRVKNIHKVASRNAGEMAGLKYINEFLNNEIQRYYSEPEHMMFGRYDPETWTPFESAYLKIKFYYKENRKRDKDNCLSMCKSLIDGFTRAGLWKDDSGNTYLPVEVESGTIAPRVEFLVYPNNEYRGAE